MTAYSRECPNCNNIIFHKNERGLKQATKRGHICDTCRLDNLHAYTKANRVAIDSVRTGHPLICIVCKASFTGTILSRYCSYKCRYKHNYVDLDPILKRAIGLSSCIKFGRGKKVFFETLVRKCVNTPCRYCSSTMSLEDLSLDHIVPFGTSANRKDKDLQRELNRPSNLQLICRRCNRLKGNLSHDSFVTLLLFLDQHPEIKSYVISKMAQANLLWRRR